MRNENLTIGFLAHVDAGKTTLSEAVLYTAGAIRKLGRVDHGTAFLDNNRIEVERGITVFSKEARFKWGNKSFTLLDTPGHADFGAEAERTLSVLDYGVLIISGADGVQGHTVTLWRLLEAYKVPVFVFVNKMDQTGTDKEKIIKELNAALGGGFVEFSSGSIACAEDAASWDETLMEEYIEKEQLSLDLVCKAIERRSIFPVCFGSALKLEGIEAFLDTVERYSLSFEYPDSFGAKVYKISRDKQGNRQSHMKITGGGISSRMTVFTGMREEKADRLLLYSGNNFEQVREASAGEICAVTGLSDTYAGQGLGAEADMKRVMPVLEPSLIYKVVLPDGGDEAAALQKLRVIEEEEPSLKVVWKEALKEIHVKVMGSLELELLKRIAKERFDMDMDFGEGSIIYKETISEPVIGIGHFEPLRHYAEVHLLMEPLERGAGLVFDTALSEDKLEGSWQRLILTHLKEREHPGVMTGSPITDMKITLIGGKAHLKHTEGGDFRQATYRAVRQGLCKAHTLLLEPMYDFRAEIPQENAGRFLSDMQRLCCKCKPVETLTADTVLIEGKGPVAALKDYQQDMAGYTKGMGRFSAIPCGYGQCSNGDKVAEQLAYDAERDLDNPTGSVFCSGGSAYHVKWNEVDEMAHIDSGYRLTADGAIEKIQPGDAALGREQSSTASTMNASQKELDEIFLKTYGKSKRDEELRRRQISGGSKKPAKPETMSGSFPQLKNSLKAEKERYFIVDGYNVLFAWEGLSDLASHNLDSARETLLEILENYSAYKKVGMSVVFDGYKASGNKGSVHEYGLMKAVYTREAQTADRFIEESVYRMAGQFAVTVVTSDRAVQMSALGDGAFRLSARDFYAEVMNTSEELRQILKKQSKQANRPLAEALADKTDEGNSGA